LFSSSKNRATNRGFYRRKNIDIVYCPVGKKENDYLIYRPLLRENFWTRIRTHHGIIITPLIRKECFSECGSFDESLMYHEDRDMWYRMQKNSDLLSTTIQIIFIIIKIFLDCPLKLKDVRR